MRTNLRIFLPACCGRFFQRVRTHCTEQTAAETRILGVSVQSQASFLRSRECGVRFRFDRASCGASSRCWGSSFTTTLIAVMSVIHRMAYIRTARLR
jgi:hypothetical protein